MTGGPATGLDLEHGAARPSRRAAWMVTFTDLVALMLAFFVMLFAMSKVEQRKWQNLVDALSDNLNAVREVPAALPSKLLGMEGVTTLPGADLDYLAELLSQHMAADPLLARGILHRRPDGLVIALPGELVFAPGSTDLAPSGRRTLIALGGLLRRLPNRIEVRGHADPRKPAGGFASNWELSLARALSVAAELRGSGYRGPVIARGFGHSRFASLSPELSEPRRLVLGRRVELVVRSHAGENR